MSSVASSSTATHSLARCRRRSGTGHPHHSTGDRTRGAAAASSATMSRVTAAAEARVGVAGNGGGAGLGQAELAAAAAAAAEGYGTKRAALATGAAHSRRPSLRVGALRPPVQRHTSARPSVCVLAEAARWSSCYSWPSTNLRILGRRPLRQEQQQVEVPGSSWIGHNTTMESKKLKVRCLLRRTRV